MSERMTPDERRELIEAITTAMTAQIGPLGDMVRANMSAKVDGLIDARKRFMQAGWPDWMIHAAMMAFITGSPGNVVIHDHEDGGGG